MVQCKIYFFSFLRVSILMDEEYLSGAVQPVCSSISDQHSVLLVCEGHGDQILSVLRAFRDKGMLFDFCIHVQDEILPCHRCVLAACSDFFRQERSAEPVNRNILQSVNSDFLS